MTQVSPINISSSLGWNFQKFEIYEEIYSMFCVSLRYGSLPFGVHQVNNIIIIFLQITKSGNGG